MKISICIPATRPDITAQAVESILNQEYDDWELLIVAQGRRHDFETMLENPARRDARIRCIHAEHHGTTRARNAGVFASRGDVIAFIDHDCTAQADWLSVIVNRFNEFPRVDVVGGALLAPVCTSTLSTCPACVPVEAIYDPSVRFASPPQGFELVGCNIAFRREILERIGPFDPYLGPGTDFPAGEDIDYVFRLERGGVQMLSTPDAVVHHTHGTRHGISALLRHSRNYAWGNGGLAGKLTLLGDARGKLLLRQTCRRVFTDVKSLKSPWRLPFAFRRVFMYREAYMVCLRRYTIVEPCILEPRVKVKDLAGLSGARV